MGVVASGSRRVQGLCERALSKGRCVAVRHGIERMLNDFGDKRFDCNLSRTPRNAGMT